MGNESAREDVGKLSIRVPLVNSRTMASVYRGSNVAGSLRAELFIIRNLKYMQMALVFFALTVSRLLGIFEIMTCKAKRLPI